MRSVDELCRIFRAKGYKVTPQRRLIFEALRDNADHPAVEDIHRRVQEVMPDMSLATIHHTLKDLVEMGEVAQLDLGDGKSRYDPATEDHHHVVCLGCRRVLDIRRAFNGLKLLPEEAPGDQIVRRELVFYGFCPGCRQ